MLKNDNPRLISLALCLFYTNSIIATTTKPDILESLGKIRALKLNEKDMRRYHLWDQGMVPYYIDDFSFDKVLRDRIRMYLDQLNKATSLHFMEIPQPPEDDKHRWVFFLNRKGQLGCDDVAYNNYTNKGVQRVVLGYDCLKPEDLDEIILSLVGVPPQHNAPDRDDYVTVNWDNILPDKHYLFEKLKADEWAFDKLKYDFSSAGHYHTHKFTSNGGETITPKNLEQYMEGRKGLSSIDIKKIRMFYNNISFKAKKPMQVPACSKLFVPGKNFSKYKTSNVSVSSEKPDIKCDSENASNSDCHKNKLNKKDDGDDDNEDVNNDDEKHKTDIKDEKNETLESKQNKENFTNENDNKSGESNDKQYNKLKIESSEEIKNDIKDKKSPNSEEKPFLLLKHQELKKNKSLNSKDKKKLISNHKTIKKIKSPQTTEIKSSEEENTKKLKGETDENKSLNSEEKLFLLAKHKIIKNDKYKNKIKSEPLTSEDDNTKNYEKLKGGTDENKSLNSEEKHFLLAKHKIIKNDKYKYKIKSEPLTSDDDKPKNYKKLKGETDENKSLNSQEKHYLLAKYKSIKNDKYKHKITKSKKLTSDVKNSKYSIKLRGETNENKSLNSEEKHYLMSKNQVIKKNKYAKNNKYSKKLKGQNDDSKTIDSEEKLFLSQKHQKIGQSKPSKTQKVPKQKKSQNNNKKKGVLLKGHPSNKLKRNILGKSDYETGEENVKFHFQ